MDGPGPRGEGLTSSTNGNAALVLGKSAVQPMISNNICLNAHPEGCAASVRRQVSYAAERGPLPGGPKRALVIGCSTGYGLASRIVAAFGYGAATLGVSFERAGAADKSGSPGFYNNREFDRLAALAGIPSATLQGDAFSDATRAQAAAVAKDLLGKIDLVVYSIASPARKDPSTGRVWQSCIKPIGQDFRGEIVDLKTGALSPVTIQGASQEEIEGCVKVMGGEDWAQWIGALDAAGLLAPGALTVAYSYVGPALSGPIYRSGTLGKAKENLEATAKFLGSAYSARSLKAYVSVMKALVTRSSMVIPSIPLYLMVLYRVMKAKGTHEGCIEQAERLFRSRLFAGGPVPLDAEGRVRLDDLELESDVQAEVGRILAQANQENFDSLGDYDGLLADFLETNGFGIPGVDYSAPVRYE
jgi:enoyl-[acyl-carrier protein] reductase / trans-2-enoyl-CoA reductase (NAD+)